MVGAELGFLAVCGLAVGGAAIMPALLTNVEFVGLGEKGFGSGTNTAQGVVIHFQ